MHRLLALVTMLVFPVAGLAQDKTPEWTCKLDTGECIGKVKMSVKKPSFDEAIGEYALTSFPNREYLFEDFSGEQVKTAR